MPEIIRPKNLNNDVTGAFFTTANRHLTVQGSHYRGLNLGFNTKDSPRQIFKTASYVLGTQGLHENQLALGKQIHGTRVVRVDAPGVYENSDGLYTSRPGIILGIQVADCAAVFIADGKRRMISAIHAGWRGAAGGIVTEGVAKMINAGGEPGDMQCYISPCISLKNFEVGEEVAAQIPAQHCDYSSYSKTHVDLKGLLKSGLMNAGIPETNIEVSEACTVESSEFYSYRREKEKSGRMLACIYLKQPNVHS